MKRFLLGCFIIVSVADIVSLLIESVDLHYFFKPMIMISLISYYSISANKINTVFLIALIFSLTGDVSLLFVHVSELFFIAGLLSFMIAHVLYIITYRKMRIKDLGTQLLGTQRIRFSFPIILYGSGLTMILLPSLHELKIPVVVYAAILVIMVLQALYRYGHTNSGSFWLVMTGAFLFLASDSMLAINKFFKPFEQAEVLIIVTYILAQYLIVKGIIRHANMNSHA